MDIKARISDLDDKDLLNVASNLAARLLEQVPDVNRADDLLPRIRVSAGEAGHLLDTLDVSWKQGIVPPPQAGPVARALLCSVASTEQGADAVAAAIDDFPSNTQDLGVFSIPLAAGLLYVAVVSDIEFEYRGIKFKKEGIPAEKQAEIIKSLLPEVFKGVIKTTVG